MEMNLHNQTGFYTGRFYVFQKNSTDPPKNCKRSMFAQTALYIKCRYCCAGLTCLCLSRAEGRLKTEVWAEKNHWTEAHVSTELTELLSISSLLSSDLSGQNKKYIHPTYRKHIFIGNVNIISIGMVEKYKTTF